MATKRKVTRAILAAEQEREPAVWITQLQNNVNYGVRDFSRLSKRSVDKAKEHFLAIKRFVEVELPQITADNETEKLRVSAERAKRPSDSEA